MTSNPSSLATELVVALGELEQVTSRLAGLAAQGAWSGVTPAALPDLVATTAASSDAVGSVLTVGVGVLHRSGALAGHGYVSTSRWLENEVGMSRSDASTLIARASAWDWDYPATRDAVLAGEVSAAKAREITRGLDTALRGLPIEYLAEQRAAGERLLLSLARTATAAQVRKAATRVRFYLDADGTTAAVLAAHEDQTLRITPTGAMVRVEGWLDAEGGALVTTALDQIVDEWFRTGSLPVEDRLPDGVDPHSAEGRRHRRPRRAHLLGLALVELARRQLDNGLLGSRHGVQPHVVLTATLGDIAAGRGGEILLPGHDDPVLVPSVTVGRMLCDSMVTGIITRQVDCPEGTPTGGSTDLVAWLRDAAHDVLYVGREHRVVPPRLRRALERRDRHCAFPGCRVDTSRTHAHHVTPWEAGGATDIDNLVLLCARHHHYVHEGGWTITKTDLPPTATGHWAFTPPRPRP
jgi:hypothetical protein